jgi:hypothetical protein
MISNVPQRLRQGLLLLLFGIVCLIITVVAMRLYSMNLQLQWPQGIPADVYLPPRTGSQGLDYVKDGKTLADKLYLPAGKQSLAIAYNQTEEMVVLFDGNGSHDGVSVGGLWTGTGAKLHITDPYEITIEAGTHTDTWGGVLHGGSSKCTPWLKVSVPISAEHYHETVRATAMMDVIYPLQYSGFFSRQGNFGNSRGQITHQISFFVVSPEEYQIISNLERKKTHGMVIATVIGCLSAIAIIIGGAVFGKSMAESGLTTGSS